MSSGPINTGALEISDYLLFRRKIAYVQLVAINRVSHFARRLPIVLTVVGNK